MHDLDQLRYIAEIGLLPGTPFHLLSCAPFKGPLRLEMNPHDQIIGYEISQSIWVEVTKRGQGNKLPPINPTQSKKPKPAPTTSAKSITIRAVQPNSEFRLAKG
jgi:Fe2+ transport system protein FeoA